MKRATIFLILSVCATFIFVSSCINNTVEEYETGKSEHLLSVKENALAWVSKDEKFIPSHFVKLALPHLGKDDHVVHAMKRTLKYTNEEIYRITIFNTSSQETRKIDLDKSGNKLDYMLVNNNNLNYAKQLYGNFTENLSNSLSTKSAKDMIDVEIWYAAPPPVTRPEIILPTTMTEKEYNKFNFKKALELFRASLVSEIKTHGGKIEFEAKYAPIIEASIQKDKLEYYLRTLLSG